MHLVERTDLFKISRYRDSHACRLREINNRPEVVHTDYNNGNNITWMGANGFKLFKIFTFGPIRK